MGVLPGVSDLVFIWENEIWKNEVDPEYFQPARSLFVRPPRVLFLELKRPNGRLTIAQAGFGLAARIAGAEFEVANSVDEAVAAVKSRGLLRDDRKIGKP
jgi:hypothetical protein